jgi:type IV secretion system protein VirB10
MGLFDWRKDSGATESGQPAAGEPQGSPPSSLADERGIPPVNPRGYQSRGQMITIASGVVLLVALMWAVNRPTSVPKSAPNDPRATRGVRFDDGKATGVIAPPIAPPEALPGALAPARPPMPPGAPIEIVPAIDADAAPASMYQGWTSSPTSPGASGGARSRELTPLQKRMRSKTVIYDSRASGTTSAAPEVPGLPGLRADGTVSEPGHTHNPTSDGAARSGPTDGEPPANDPHSVAAILRPTKLEGASASRFPNRTLMLASGKLIDCTLDTAISTVVAGMTKCTLPRNVVSEDGKVVLLERGTELTGEYRSALGNGQARLGIVWARAKTPRGVIIELSSPATDALGRGGVEGFVDNHFWQRYGAAILLSSLDDAMTLAVSRASSNQIYVPTATTNTGQTAAAVALQADIQIPPTIVVNQGEHVAVFVARDLDFRPVYSYRAPPIAANE